MTALVTAAHKLDATPSKRRRRWPRVLAGAAMLAAALAAAAAVALRRRSDRPAYEPAGPTLAEESTTPPAAEAADKRAEADGSKTDAEVNGQFLRS